MKTNPIAVALKAKGLPNLYRRVNSITRRYGFNSGKMERSLGLFSEVLEQFNCSATFPVTAVALKRNTDTIRKYLGRNIEIAVHGYTHVDYAQLEPQVQADHLKRAREVFSRAGIPLNGFRSPYLSWNDSLCAAVAAEGFSYVSNRVIEWDALDYRTLEAQAAAAYERAINFYHPWRSNERLSLPRLDNQLVEIPVSLPDDEILVERLAGSCDLIEKTWQFILSQTYQRGELFTLQLHPERIMVCASSLAGVLKTAKVLEPKVWITRLDEIAAWWKARASAAIEVCEVGTHEFNCTVDGPGGTTVLARGVEVNVPSSPWANGYHEVKAASFKIKSFMRPWIGLAPGASLNLAHFLRQQGYILETSQDRGQFSSYFDQVNFDAAQEMPLLAQIEGSGRPLLRVGRWPNGAQSALAVTGDIDALTLWDYGLRIIGK